MKKDILLIAFAYPPFNSIGSRRWAKFSKYLAKKGYKIHVIAAKNPSETSCTWISDIQDINIKAHYIPSFYADLLLNFSNNFFKKIIKKSLIITLKIFTRGNVYDLGLFWKKEMIEKSKKLINENGIQNIIVTGPPFRANYYATKLKNYFPDINLISDLRDPWLDGNLYKTTFSKATLEQEFKFEKEVIIKSNYILHTDNAIHNEYVNRYKGVVDGNKFKVFTHAYDDLKMQELLQNEVVKEKQGNIIKFIFGGNITVKSYKEILEPLFIVLKKMSIDKPTYYLNLQFIFYTDYQPIVSLKEKYDIDIVTINKTMGENEFYKEVINKADYLFLFLPSNLKDFITTKYADYLALKKPYLNISAKGRVSAFVEENSLGYNIYPEAEMYSQLLTFIDRVNEGSIPFDPNFKFDKFSYSSLTDRLEKLFI